MSENRTLSIFRRIAREFSDVPDDEVLEWMADCRALTEVIFSGTTQVAHAYLTAHFMWMADDAEELSEKGAKIASLSRAGASVSYAQNTPNLAEMLAAFQESPYGRIFLSKRQARAGAI